MEYTSPSKGPFMPASSAPSAPAAQAQGTPSLLKYALLAIVISLAANSALFFVGSALGAFPPTAILPNNEPMTLPPVVIGTVGGLVLATIGFAVLRRFTRMPVLIFRIGALIVLVLSAFRPLTIPGVSTSMIIVLNIMHVVVVGSAIWAFTGSGR